MRSVLQRLSQVYSPHALNMHAAVLPLAQRATARSHRPGLRAPGTVVARPAGQLLQPRAQAPAAVLQSTRPPDKVSAELVSRYKPAAASQHAAGAPDGLRPGEPNLLTLRRWLGATVPS